MMLAGRGPQGKQGKAGPRGAKGEKGSPAKEIAEWRLDSEHYFAVPFHSDGSAGRPLRLFELFARYRTETKE
jgi:hypothetical protein